MRTLSIILAMTSIMLLSANISAKPIQSDEQNLYDFFKHLEEDFKSDKIGEATRYEANSCNQYSIDIPLPGLTDIKGSIYKFDNGLSFFANTFQSLTAKDEMLKALTSFSSSKGFEVKKIHTENNILQYAVKKTNGKDIGFIKIYKEEEEWQFIANVAMDINRLNVDMKNLLLQSKTKFASLKGKNTNQKEGPSQVYELKGNIPYMYGKSLYISPEETFVLMDCMLYSKEAFITQLDKNPPTLSGYKYKRIEKNEHEILYSYANDAEILIIKVLRASKSHLNFNVAITSIPNPNPPAGSLEATEISAKSQLLEMTKRIREYSLNGGVSEKMKAFNNFNGTTSERKDKLNQAASPLQDGYDLLNSEVHLLYDIMSTGNPNECPKVEKGFYDLIESAGWMRTHLQNALYSLDLFMKTNIPKELDYYGKGVINHYNSYIEAYGKFTNLYMEFFELDFECPNRGESPKEEYKRLSSTFMPIPQPAFDGDYHGNDLIQLLARHKNDPAVKAWLSNPLYQFKQTDSAGDYYTGKGIEVLMLDEHLKSIKIYKDYPHKNMPEGVTMGQSQSNLASKWRFGRNESRFFFKEGIEYNLWYDAGSQKIIKYQLSIRIQPVSMQEVEEELVGVGMEWDKFNSKLRVKEVTEYWGAYDVGIRKGTEIISIDGKRISEMDKNEASNTIYGKYNTKLSLGFVTQGKEYIAELYRGCKMESSVIEIKSTPIPPTNKIASPPKKEAPQKTISPTTNNTPPSTPKVDEKIGIGMSYFAGKESDLMEVMWISKSGAAYKAGLRSGDYILKINGENMKGKSENDAAIHIEGTKGGEVKLTIDRDGKTMKFTVIR